MRIPQMSRVGRIYSAALSATYDRYFITKASKKQKLDSVETNLRNYVERTSGASTHDPIEAMKRWRKAYKVGISRIKKNEQIEKQFKTPSMMSKIVDYVVGVIKK